MYPNRSSRTVPFLALSVGLHVLALIGAIFQNHELDRSLLQNSKVSVELVSPSQASLIPKPSTGPLESSPQPQIPQQPEEKDSPPQYTPPVELKAPSRPSSPPPASPVQAIAREPAKPRVKKALKVVKKSAAPKKITKAPPPASHYKSNIEGPEEDKTHSLWDETPEDPVTPPIDEATTQEPVSPTHDSTATRDSALEEKPMPTEDSPEPAKDSMKNAVIESPKLESERAAQNEEKLKASGDSPMPSSQPLPSSPSALHSPGAVATHGVSGGSPQGAPVRNVNSLRQMPGNQKPLYDTDDRYHRREGSVRFLAYVTSTGTLTQIKQLQSSGHPTLDNKSFNAVRTWRFYPGQEGWVEIPLIWTLKGGAEPLPTGLRRSISQK